MRVGLGYDIHRLVTGRKLVLGGVEIPFEKGLDGHSDADVLVHAVCDAVLGAAGMDDIGAHFPETDDRFRDIRSLLLLEEVRNMISGKGFAVINIDATVIAQAPRLGSYREAMEKNIAGALSITSSLVNVKFTTNEKLGPVGTGEGIAAMGIAMVESV
ncbi:MAG: 2-C-methyl-D-erythritol 2,4-cyclodiphosphate synthase [Desulfococcus sp. 4484_241]|nr:MAG: 2-C-methyl-D-erythritol 2,4-cyclodiphosphate synthase [Desulfococcus sp. 4484_241]